MIMMRTCVHFFCSNNASIFLVWMLRHLRLSILHCFLFGFILYADSSMICFGCLKTIYLVSSQLIACNPVSEQRSASISPALG